MIHSTLCLFSVLMVSLTQSPEVINDTVSIYRNIEYVAYGDESLTLDIYVPSGITEAVPGIVVIPGGGFRPQVKERFANDFVKAWVKVMQADRF